MPRRRPESTIQPAVGRSSRSLQKATVTSTAERGPADSTSTATEARDVTHEAIAVQLSRRQRRIRAERRRPHHDRRDPADPAPGPWTLLLRSAHGAATSIGRRMRIAFASAHITRRTCASSRCHARDPPHRKKDTTLGPAASSCKVLRRTAGTKSPVRPTRGASASGKWAMGIYVVRRHCLRPTPQRSGYCVPGRSD